MSTVSQNIEDFESLLVTLQNSLGVIVPDEKRSDLAERIQPLLTAHQFDNLASLTESMHGDEKEKIRSEILDAISHSQSSWVISPEIHSVLHDYVLSQLPENARIWIVGCGQGQQAYAIAMEIAEYEHQTDSDNQFRLIATDVSSSNVKYAEMATYSEAQMNGLSEAYKKLFVAQDASNGSGKIKEKIRRVLSFDQCDLNDDFHDLGEMDLIICPQALVYFSNDIKLNILKNMSDQLRSGGIFIAGDGQINSQETGGLERVDHPAGVFYRKKK